MRGNQTVLPIILIGALLLTGCAAPVASSKGEKKDPQPASSSETSPGVPLSEESQREDYVVRMEDFTFDKGEYGPYKTKYAQVSGLDNKQLERKINNTLKVAATEWLGEEYYWVEDCKVYVKCQTPQYLSIWYVKEWPHYPKFDGDTRFGITVNMQTGERVFLEDLVGNLEDFKLQLLSYKYPDKEFNELAAPVHDERANQIVHDTALSEKQYNQEQLYGGKDPLRLKCSFYLTNSQMFITRNGWEECDLYLDLASLK